MEKLMLRGWFTCALVCLSCFLIPEKLSAEVNGGDEVRTVTLNMRNVSLKEILTEIEKQAGVTFSYESSLLKEFQKTSFKVEDAALDDCLTRLFDGYPLVYKRTGNIVVLKRKPRQVTILSVCKYLISVMRAVRLPFRPCNKIRFWQSIYGLMLQSEKYW